MIALVLAAGLSRRMGRQKLLMPFRGGLIIDAVLRNVTASGFERIIAVTSAEVLHHLDVCGYVSCTTPNPQVNKAGSGLAERSAGVGVQQDVAPRRQSPGMVIWRRQTQTSTASPLTAPPRGLSITAVLNERPERGQSSSLILGVEAIEDESDFCVILGDQPLVTAEEISKYREMFDKRDAQYTALVPWRCGRIGHPVFFSSLWRARLTGAEADAGGRFIVSRFAEEVLKTPGEESFFTDIDTPEDYENITKSIE